MIRLGLHTSKDASTDAPHPSEAGSLVKERSAADLEALKQRLPPIFGARFEVLEPIAIGGMATLFQLRHRLHDGLLVAKVLHAELASRPGVVASFQQEAQHAAQAGGHPNAVPIFDSGESDGLHFLLMPFVTGEDLDHLLEAGGPLPRAEALRLGYQISHLLCLLESQGIAHGDLAPGNIRLDVFGRYRVLDFGLSHRANAKPYLPLGGTPLYNSPEQIRGEAPDVRSDMYSLGVVLCEVLTGRSLLDGKSLAELKAQHLTGAWHFPEPLAADGPLAGVLKRMLEADRAKRFASAQELCSALAKLGTTELDLTQSPLSRNLAGPRPGETLRRPRLSA